MSGRILSIDYGTRRVGFAITDPMNIIAQGLDTLQYKAQIELINHIKSLSEEFNIETIIIGMPLNLKGEKGMMAKEVEEFRVKLEETLNLPVLPIDERFTSFEAERHLRSAGIKPSKQKHLIDKISATILLQQYLNIRPQDKF